MTGSNLTGSNLLLTRMETILFHSLLVNRNRCSRSDRGNKFPVHNESMLEVQFPNMFRTFFYPDKLYLPSLYSILQLDTATGILTLAGHEVCLVVRRSPLMVALLKSITMQSAVVARSPTASGLVLFLHPIYSDRGSNVSAKQ